MLELTGACCGSIEAVELFESLAEIIPEDDRTDEFCEKYERALNRFRYEAAKGVGKKKKFIKAVHRGHHDLKYCGHCGAGANEPSWKYCPDCGTRYLEEFEMEKKEKFVERCQVMLHKDMKPKKEQCDGQMSLEV